MRLLRAGVRLPGLVAVGAWLAASVGYAHDFWIEPSPYRPGVPSLLAVRLLVGEPFGQGSAYPRNPDHLRSFVIVGPTGTRDVVGRPGGDPAGFAHLDAPGTYVIGYRSARSVVELDALHFERYLQDEHFEDVARRRLARGLAGLPGREAFSRCAKAIVVAGDGNPGGYDHNFGFTLELIPERNPVTVPVGEELPVRLLYDGVPLPEAYVAAINAADAGTRLERRTDAQGRVRLRLDRSGVWLVRSVHLTPAAPGLGVDWESVWASLTFEVRASP